MVKKRILCVDDEECFRLLLKEHLTEAGYQVQMVIDGTQALEVLNNSPNEIEAVLLDRIMPDMDGLEVLKEMKTKPNMENIPVIMQTALTAADDIRKGLVAGARYYLAKPFEKQTLLSVTKNAVDDHRKLNRLQEALEQTAETLILMDRGSFRYRQPEEARALASLLANASPNPSRAVVGLTELMLNAVEHGNLGITYDEKTDLKESNTLFEEIEVRLSLPKYSNRTASLSYERTHNHLHFIITDEGDGFDWKQYLEADPKRAFDTHGRGILIANQISFDKIEFLGNGNQVHCWINLRD